MYVYELKNLRWNFEINILNWSDIFTLEILSISCSFLIRLCCLVYVKNEGVDFMAIVNDSLPRTTYIMWTFFNDLCLHWCVGSHRWSSCTFTLHGWHYPCSWSLCKVNNLV